MAYERDIEEGAQSESDELPENSDAMTAVDGIETGTDDDSDAPVLETELAEQPDEQLDDEDFDDEEFVSGGDVRADNVTITQGSAQNVDAVTVSITQGAAARVSAADVSVSQGAVALARAESLHVDEGGSAFAVIADSASVAEGGNVFMLLARNVTGEVRPILDWRAALAFGAAFAVVLRILRRR
jgi:hypothetical protein